MGELKINSNLLEELSKEVSVLCTIYINQRRHLHQVLSVLENNKCEIIGKCKNDCYVEVYLDRHLAAILGATELVLMIWKSGREFTEYQNSH